MKGNEPQLKEITHYVDRGKVMSKGEGSGDSVDAALVSDTVTRARTFSLADSARGWDLLR